MSEKGFGKPVDKLDRACKIYKECIQCSLAQFGSECKPELKTYLFETDSGRVMCTNQRGTCGRALCECDKHFAKIHSLEYESFNPNFSNIKQMDQQVSANSEIWDSKKNCEARTTYRTNFDKENGNGRACCSGAQKMTPFLMYNSLT